MHWIVTLWLKTLRFKIKDREPDGILALWHKDMPAALTTFAHQDITIMISSSKDGNFATKVAESLGYTVKRGSSSRGYETLRTLVRALRKGESVGMALDGPKGPPMVAKPGCSWLSKQSKRPIAYLNFEYSASVTLRTWDSMRIPLPFSKILVSFKHEYAS
ncbi:MAG: DUF374 domain-containing protein [Fibrobacter sp.]|nr:DUF374 domain-containing protein [Fibrobacter sp.]